MRFIKEDGNITRTYVAPEVRCIGLRLSAPPSGDVGQGWSFVADGSCYCNGSRVNPLDLVRFCDEVLELLGERTCKQARK